MLDFLLSHNIIVILLLCFGNEKGRRVVDDRKEDRSESEKGFVANTTVVTLLYQRKERREENIDLSISLTLDEHPNLVSFKMLVLFLVSPFSTSLTHYLTLIKTFVSLYVCAFMHFHTTNTFWLVQNSHHFPKKINV